MDNILEADGPIAKVIRGSFLRSHLSPAIANLPSLICPLLLVFCSELLVSKFCAEKSVHTNEDDGFLEKSIHTNERFWPLPHPHFSGNPSPFHEEIKCEFPVIIGANPPGQSLSSTSFVVIKMEKGGVSSSWYYFFSPVFNHFHLLSEYLKTLLSFLHYRFSKPRLSHASHFSLNMELLAERSAKVAYILKENPQLKFSSFIQDIPGDPEIIEIVGRFCCGFEPALSSENVIPLTCLAFYLEMTESHSKNNLIKKLLTFFEETILTNWNQTIIALRSAATILQQVERFGLFDACLQSLVDKALLNPRLVADPIKNPRNDEDSEDDDDDEKDEENYIPKARRRLFLPNWKSEALITLPLHLYCPIIQRMNQYQILTEYVAGSLCLYAEKWVFCNGISDENMSMYKRKLLRDVIEAVERLLPDEKGLIPCTFLFKMLKYAVSLESSNECRHGFEQRIGKQLHQATVKDLLIPSQGYTRETQYDIECVRRILKHFFGNYTTPDSSGFIPVAQLIEDFLTEVASDIDLEIDTFVNLAEMALSISLGLQKNSDGIYRAIDIYFDRHRYLTEQEREGVCKILDCHKMTPEACEHAVKNERLPLRFVVQVLFVTQLHMRDTIAHKVEAFDSKSTEEEADEEKEGGAGFDDEQVRAEMEKMSIKVKELEKKCYVMRKEINNGNMKKEKEKEKSSKWKEMKRKLGCISSMNDCNSQLKKKKAKVRSYFPDHLGIPEEAYQQHLHHGRVYHPRL
ncbi:BTB/POZ domain-containing protein At5g17580 [Euphorbia lathyris]|uniref:BTB/POZ domain-containing protein At5g17580 n=1 Tax=Euphorbia lathyris TaxID=212925 RepID=UPI0033137A62